MVVAEVFLDPTHVGGGDGLLPGRVGHLHLVARVQLVVVFADQVAGKRLDQYP